MTTQEQIEIATAAVEGLEKAIPIITGLVAAGHEAGQALADRLRATIAPLDADAAADDAALAAEDAKDRADLAAITPEPVAPPAPQHDAAPVVAIPSQAPKVTP